MYQVAWKVDADGLHPFSREERRINHQVSYKTRRRTNLKTKDLIAEAISLPVEEKAIVVDSILKSLNPPAFDIDRKWATVARRRLSELRSGKVKAIPGEEVFSRIWERFSS
jgi:putative addiction module component (TIGR02574 family)